MERCPRSPPTGGRLSLKGPGSGSKRPQAHWPLASRGAAEPDPECQASAVLGRSHSRTACRETQQVPVVHPSVRAAAAKRGEGFQEGGLEAPGAPPPPAPGPAPQTSRKIYLATRWEHHLCPAVAQSGPSPAPSLGAQMSLGPGPAAGGHNRGKAVFCSSANGNTDTWPVQWSRGCTSGKPLSFDLKSPPQNL